MTTEARPLRPHIGEVWMILQDHKRLAKLMVIQGVSQRELALAAGWRSHSYMARLLKGEVKTLKTDPACRIAKHLGVGVDDLFLVAVDSNPVHSVQGTGRAA